MSGHCFAEDDRIGLAALLERRQIITACLKNCRECCRIPWLHNVQEHDQRATSWPRVKIRVLERKIEFVANL